MLMLETCRGW